MNIVAVWTAGLLIPMTWRIAVTVSIIMKDGDMDIGWAADAAAADCSTTANCGC